MIPAEHRTAAEDLLERHAGGRGTDRVLSLRMQAHAALAGAAGTGPSYAAANTLLAKVEARGFAPIDPAAGAMVERALAHALMADR